MSLNPSWKWLSSRLTARDLAAQAKSSKTPSRPCLPAVEQLDQRVMLSAAADIIVEPPNPTTSPQILIGLIKGELDLIKGELEALKLASADLKLAETPNLIHKLTESFLKIDDVFYKYGQDLIKGEIDGIKGEILADKAMSELDFHFLKITDLVGDKSENLDGVIAILKDNATSLLSGLTRLGPGGELEHKDEQSLINFVNKFDQAADAVLKLEEFALDRKPPTGTKVHYLEIKLEDLLVSSLKLDDKIKSQVDAEGIIAVLIGLLKPAENPTDGVSIVTTDDVILG
jgi:hypothetical protein